MIFSISRRRLLSVGLVNIFAFGVFASCKNEERSAETVVLYSSVDWTYTDAVVSAFEAETGLEVDVVSDTEAAKSTGLVNRLQNERKRPVADVFWSGDPMRSAWLEREGLGKRISEKGAAYRMRMIMIHSEREPEGSARPGGVLELADPRFAKMSCIANPQFGTTSLHFAALYLELGEEGFRKFLKDFRANGGTLVASNGEVKRRVSSGEFVYGLTDSDDVSVALEDKYPVEWILADENRAGAIAIPTTAVLIEGAPHPEKARRLAEFLNSPAMEKIMAEGVASHIPVLGGQTKSRSFDIDLKQRRLANYKDSDLADALDRIRPILDEWLTE